ncbi:phytoene desaturase family protein [Mycobacterium marseillense]|uniref:Dehydrogenase n=1 Tax=Mycobacterium marseillense TaxID=701042 RepID=A0ABN5ZQR1_9MYCO|nr:NAD(P)/FAD-dependent oxidoreductase [Mycobacterium marseillense]MCA2266422.1 NAD(P)/FAD-dependent oxidoreductase [Mycobacterium marseillense]MCV7407647.1 NAD(P)/FAD-dependent oxidoreductase [Mycobacterium marseillense]OBJ74254.1 FAD-dependent oxidoreductase [Mycobacterium marseillense]ORA86078.1 FAD-dependent oxidoreductase [Mycobacterium marseillense]BBY10777.1 dehydrogenase [Mycobacterium marseillense]
MARAVVVGAGPNGLAAAIHLARHGVDVQVLEAGETVGGGARSAELTVPGVIHDVCSATHPFGVGSPYWQEIDLPRYGLVWKWPEIDCAHPLDDGTAGVLYQSLDRTVAGMGIDATRWRLAVGGLAAGFDQLAQDLLRPVLRVPHHPLRLAAFGPRALLPATVLARWFRTEQARALFGGAAAHIYTRLDRPLTASLGLLFLAAGHRYGWPVAEGGSGAITRALAAALQAHGGAITTGITVTGRRDIPDADIVMLDLTPAAALQIYGDVLPGRVKRAYRRFRRGSSAFKVDFAIEGHIPWTNPECRRAGSVHLGGTFAETADTERQRAQGTMAQRPFVLVGQQYLADPSRSAGDINPIWAYAHVPFGYTGDATAAIVDQIERFAPGFRDRVVATVSRGTADLEAYNPNYIGGDILGGANDGLQVILRPRVSVNPYATGVPGVYLCSQSTPPGAGIHGLCGYHAAEAALGRLRKRRR